MSLYQDIVDFLCYEAELLDERRFDEWLELLDDNVVYRMPLRITRDLKRASNVVDDMTFFEENKQSLITRVRRLETASAWAEIPATRTRHFVSNVRIEPVDPVHVKVRSYFQVLRTRRSVIEPELLFGERHDLLKRTEGGWRVLQRIIYPDQPVLNNVNLSFFL
ncbi:MAG: aromatic-ring-hydroxylating dioxygenase subunit beta [Alicyclobacillus mali]|uniref:aromatic-ring-hydroxylating dioxygenase subunit beta n=1 Tax=Alicyclobacillus mali (ex Roth et al. 2021) TaxID=1123961 RepID=UPI0023F04EFD|nr:aromatic-ring-hydroxylating dioxygenase subunit beta [Alicyclobacillus mali (ex Roth et al. 2021)]MCL6487709.1 aromatic-ring-hydroxylating dioxygenase subunit beta [Alicyclobacillus mali (ex Roth et al. 2021)]